MKEIKNGEAYQIQELGNDTVSSHKECKFTTIPVKISATIFHIDKLILKCLCKTKELEYLIFFLKDKMGGICFPSFNMAIKTVEANGQKVVFQRPQK